MKTETHLKFAKKLADQYLPDSSAYNRLMFIIGSVTPDINPFSYLKGFSVKPFFGHNWGNRRDYLSSGLRDLLMGRLSYFSLGQLVHFICDAFTFTHNITYKGGLYEHSRYEKALHTLFEKLDFSKEYPDLHLNINDGLNSLHEQYLSQPQGCENDLRFIMQTVHYALKHGIPHARKHTTMPTNTAR